MTLTTPPSHVAIIGGGLAGLTLALALHDLHIPSTVYESRSEDHDQGGGILLSPNALRVLDSVGVYQRIREHAFQLDVLAFKDSQNNTTDEYYFGSELIYGYPAIRIIHKELLDEMRAMLRERQIPVQYNSKLTTIVADGPDQVEFAFENGKTALAPLVIGADGIHSAVRKSLKQEEHWGMEHIAGYIPNMQFRVWPQG